jgi:hypothetical protein
MVATPFIPGSGQWATKSVTIPSTTNKLLFRAVSAYGNNIFIDNITISEPVVEWNGSVSGQWHNPNNWTPNGIPTANQSISISSGKPFYPIVSTLDGACKNMEVNNGAAVSVLVGSGLTVFGNLTIQNGASLDNKGTMVVKGNLTNNN